MSRGHRVRRPAATASVGAAAAIVLLLFLTGFVGVADVLCLAPALAIALSLLGRRYPGESLLRRLARRRPARRGRPLAAPAPRTPEPASPHGGLLIGLALAVRPPPAALPAR